MSTHVRSSIYVSGYSCFCDSNEIRCADGKCVPMTKVMDGRNDCKEGKYDEGRTLFTVFNVDLHILFVNIDPRHMNIQ